MANAKKKPAAKKRAVRRRPAARMREDEEDDDGEPREFSVVDLVNRALDKRRTEERAAEDHYTLRWRTIHKGALARAIATTGLPSSPARWSDEDERTLFIEMVREHGNIHAACAALKKDRNDVAKWKAKDGFEVALKEAKKDAADSVELEAWRRAMLGVDEITITVDDGPDGQKTSVKHAHHYSDRLLEKMLAGVKPKRYGRENVSISSPKDKPVKVDTGEHRETREEIMSSLLGLVKPKSDDPDKESRPTTKKRSKKR